MIKEKMKQLVGRSIKAYTNEYSKPKIDELKFKEQYQGRIIDCMVGEVDDNYIDTPETDNPIVKLEHSKEGVVKIPSIKGKTILVDSEGNETDTPGEGCRLISVGEEEDNRLLISSKNKNLNSKVYFGAIYNGEFSGSDSKICSEYIRGYNGIKYVASIRHDKIDVFFFEIYDLKGNYIKQIPATQNNYTPEFDCFFRCWRTRNSTDSWLQVEIDKQTSHVEPQSHKTEILLDEPLRSIDDIKDIILRENNKTFIKRNCYSFKPTLNDIIWVYRETENTERQTHAIAFSTNNPKHSKCKSMCNILSWHDLRKLNDGTYLEGFDNYTDGTMTSNKIYLQVKWETVGITNSDSITERNNKVLRWLVENNAEFILVQDDPIIKELPNSITLQGFDDTTMYVENEITPTVQYGYNALIPYKQELLNQKDEVETNTLDIEQNIIPYLMDMEFNLMLMEDN